MINPLPRYLLNPPYSLQNVHISPPPFVLLIIANNLFARIKKDYINAPDHFSLHFLFLSHSSTFTTIFLSSLFNSLLAFHYRFVSFNSFFLTGFHIYIYIPLYYIYIFFFLAFIIRGKMNSRDSIGGLSGLGSRQVAIYRHSFVFKSFQIFWLD